MTFFTGQPKLISTTLTRNSWASLAPTAASVAGSLSQICTASGRGFFLHAPQAGRETLLVLFHPQKALGVESFPWLAGRPRQAAHDLPEGVVGEAGHRRLQHRRIDHQRADVEGSDPGGQIEIGCLSLVPFRASRGGRKASESSPGHRRGKQPDLGKAGRQRRNSDEEDFTTEVQRTYRRDRGEKGKRNGSFRSGSERIGRRAGEQKRDEFADERGDHGDVEDAGGALACSE